MMGAVASLTVLAGSIRTFEFVGGPFLHDGDGTAQLASCYQLRERVAAGSDDNFRMTGIAGISLWRA